jgi:hypothetical protein
VELTVWPARKNIVIIPWCHRKWWAYSWLWSSPVSPFLVLMSLDFSIGKNVALDKIHNSKQKAKKFNTSNQPRKILYTDSQDVLVLSYIVTSHYYNCCTDGSTNPGNYHVSEHKVLKKILILGVASCCIHYQDFIMVAVNRKKFFIYFPIFHSCHYMFRPMWAIFR